MAGEHWARKKIVLAIKYDFKVNKTKIGNRKLKLLASDHTTHQWQCQDEKIRFLPPN